MNQLHIREQMYIRGLNFLKQMMNCNNLIVDMCVRNASEKANSPIGYKFAYYRNVCAINIKTNDDIHNCINRISKCNILSAERTGVVNNLCTLIDTRNEHVVIEGFEKEEIHCIINHIAEM